MSGWTRRPLRTPKPTPTVNNEGQPTWAPAAPGKCFGPLWTRAPPPHFCRFPPFPPFAVDADFTPDLCICKMLRMKQGTQQYAPNLQKKLNPLLDPGWRTCHAREWTHDTHTRAHMSHMSHT